MALRDHLTTLGISETADAQEIKSAYKALAKKYHPDTNSGDLGAEKKFKEINAAFHALKDAGYLDKGRKTSSAQGTGGGAGKFSFEDSEIFDSIFGMMRERMRNQADYGMDPGFGFDMRDSKKHSGRSEPPRRGDDVEDTIEVTLEQAFTATHVVIDGKCNEKIRVKVPEGVLDGAQLRIKGHGGKGTHGGENGDLIVTVRLRDHRTFTLDGRNLRMRLDVPFTMAISGGAIDFHHLDGRKHIVDVPPFWKGETTLVAKGSGWPSKDPAAIGHLLIDLKAILPVNLNDRQRKLLSDFEQSMPEYRSDKLASRFNL